jgi:hypothetical protein
MFEELAALEKNIYTWDLVPFPMGDKIISYK